MKSIRILPLFALIVITGCAHGPKKHNPKLAGPPALGPAPIAAYSGQQTLIDQTISPRPMPIVADPMAVRYQDKVVEIDLEPYIDENGNAYGPQKKYMLSKSGGWNRAALRNPNNAYIPADNQEAIPGPAEYTPYIAPGSAPTSTDVSHDGRKAKTIREFYDIKDVTITGLVERSQAPQAQQMADALGGEVVPIFDGSIGWILVPKGNLVISEQANTTK